MNIVLALIISLFSLNTLAHNMGDEIKRERITRALASYSSQISRADIEIDSAPLKLDYQLQKARLDTGDQDIDEIEAKFEINNQQHRLNCDLLSGEVGKDRVIYFLVYKNCTLINLENYKVKEVAIKKQFWSDWKY